MASRLCLHTVVSSMLLVAAAACATRQPPDVTSAAPPALAGDLTTQLAPYVEAQQALAADDLDGARVALEALLVIADDVTRPLTKVAAAADSIETMRTDFKPLSEFLAAMDLPAGYARAYCPMYDGGSNWVQVDGPLRNPYYGSTMLTCGVIDAAPGAHMDHTPRHGGTVFMAPDSFHHIEGAYPEAGRFRVYATNNFREPVDVSLWMGRAVLEEEYDEATDEFREVVAFPLLPSPDGAYLEAEVGNIAVPAEITAKLQVVENFPEDRFDFIFMEWSSGVGGRAPLSVADAAPVAVPLAERIRPQIPELTGEIVNGIAGRNQEISDLVTRGAFAEIFIPALQAKELALALNDRAADLPARARNDVRIAIRSLVRAAWLLDWYGDLGNKQQVAGAYAVFVEAVEDITRVYTAADAR